MVSPDYFSVLMNLPVGVCAVDNNLTLRFWNRQMEVWTGLSLEAVIDKSLTEVFPHLDNDVFIERINDSIFRKIPQVFSSRLGLSVIVEEHSPGTPMEQRTSIVPGPITNEDENYSLIVIEDISELKKEVEAYRRMKDRAIMALNEQLKAEKEVFEANEEANLYLDVMAHDLNNYNNVILGYASLLENSEDETVRKYSKGIVLAAERSFQIIQSVSAVRKFKANDSVPSVISLDNAVNQGIDHYSHANISYADTGAKVKADNLLQEVFANLFGNSIRSGGMDIRIVVNVEDEGDHYTIHVDDNGPGLSEEEMSSLSCNSGEKEGVQCILKSTGLQLYIVCKLLERYGTSLETGTSSLKGEGKGSRFSFSLEKA